MQKINLGIIFGGKSAEHEVSLQSAKNIIDAVDKSKYDITLIGADKDGKFHLYDSKNYLVNEDDPSNIRLIETKNKIAFVPGERNASIYNIDEEKFVDKLDVIFPIIHGPFGEDGSLQGLLKLLNVPFVGSGVIGSAVGMDKDIMKRLLSFSDIDISKFIVYKNIEDANYNLAKDQLGLPMFIKPANLGSSVGISKISNEDEFIKGLKIAFKFDRKIIVEEFIDGREIECSVKGNEEVSVSTVGEILPTKDFYSYDAKYVNEGETKIEIPAKMDEDKIKEIKEIAMKTYSVLETKGLARIDFFVTEDRIIVNEINTLPGFTKISMYPKLWEKEGLRYPSLIDQLITLAIEEFNENNNLKTSV